MLPSKKRISKRYITAIVLFFASIFVFGYLAHEVVKNSEYSFDTKIFAFFSSRTTPALVTIMKGLSFLGSHRFLIPAHSTILLILLLEKRWQDAIVTTLMAAGGLCMMLVLKNYFHRDRPELKLTEVVKSFSFPSGHTLSSFVFAAVLIFLLWENKWPKRRKAIVFCLLVLLSFSIGISRIVLRVHYPSDVLAGFCAGISLVIFALWINGVLISRLVNRWEKDDDEEH
ncbi:MAG: phosphatase PAP2 family protein [Bacteroidota bacterium]